MYSMKHLKQLAFLLIGTLILTSCGYKKEAQTVVQDFFSALKAENEERMVELYPELDSIRKYWKSDTMIIKSIDKLSNDEYQVALTSKYTNGIGKTTVTEMTFFTRPVNKDKPGEGYTIYDSKGFASLNDDLFYKFAKRRGYLKEAGLTDQQILQKIAESRQALVENVKKFVQYLHEHVTVEGLTWDALSDYASGRGVVKNNTEYRLPNLKYVVTFYKEDGSELTQDTGVITYSELRPHGMESFSFFTQYAGRAARAKVVLDFDTEFVLSVAAERDFD